MESSVLLSLSASLSYIPISLQHNTSVTLFNMVYVRLGEYYPLSA